MSDNFENQIVNFNDSAMRLKTRVVIMNQNNDIEDVTHNMTVLGGRMSLETIFKPDAILQTNHTSALLTAKIDSNDKFTNPVPSINTVGTGEDFASIINGRKIRYFCIGNGGWMNNNTVHISHPRNHETRLYNMVPFICVPIENEVEKMTGKESKYALRRIYKTPDNKQYVCYFAKKFDPGSLNLKRSSGAPYTPDTNHSDPINLAASGSGATGDPLNGDSIVSFFEFNLDIEAEDFKNWHKLNNNNKLDGAILTEFGIILGDEKEVTSTDAKTYKEIRYPELFSKIVHSPSYMDMENNAKRIIYTIYS